MNDESYIHLSCKLNKCGILDWSYKKYINMAQAFFSFIIILTWFPLIHLAHYYYYVGVIKDFSLIGQYLVDILNISWFILLFCFLLTDDSFLKKRTAFIFLLFSFFMITTYGWILIHYLLGDIITADPQLLNNNKWVLSNYMMLFFGGYYFKLRNWETVIPTFFIFIFISVCYFVNWETYIAGSGRLVNPYTSIAYQMFSRTAIFCGLFAWAALQKSLSRLIIIAMLVIVLFITGSRADFWFLIVLLPLILWFTLNSRKHLFYTTLRFLSALIAFVVVSFEQGFLSRIFRIFTPSADGSIQLRIELFSVGLERLIKAPVFGDYGGELAVWGSTGYYMHNFLSVWQAFALFPFLLYCGFIAILAYGGYMLMVKHGFILDRQKQVVVLISIMAILQVLLARAYGWAELALALGLMAGMDKKG